MKKIILTGGGTAGHVIPNLALVEMLRNFDEVHYVGSIGGMEKGLVEGFNARGKRQVVYHELPCVKLVRAAKPSNLLVPFRLLNAINKAKKLIKELEPTVIFSKGGYVGLPICLAAKRVPVVVHESDLGLGLANKMAIKGKNSRLLTSFKLDVGECVGSPLRREIYCGNALKAKKLSGLTAPLPFLLVTGGSQGARAINEAVWDSIDELTARFNVVHVTGKGNANGMNRRNYYQMEFAEDMPDWLALSDFALTRGGANTLFELAALAIPSLIVPLPKTVSRGDQILNAQYFQNMGGAIMLEQENLTTATLVSTLDTLINNKAHMQSALASARNIDGTARIADILNAYANN